MNYCKMRPDNQALHLFVDTYICSFHGRISLNSDRCAYYMLNKSREELLAMSAGEMNRAVYNATLTELARCIVDAIQSIEPAEYNKVVGIVESVTRNYFSLENYNMANHFVPFDAEKLERLKIKYQETLKQGLDVFEFDGEKYFIGYAKYLIQYLESTIKREDTECAQYLESECADCGRNSNHFCPACLRTYCDKDYPNHPCTSEQ